MGGGCFEGKLMRNRCRSSKQQRLNVFIKVLVGTGASLTPDNEATTAVHATVPPIFHCIVASARKMACNLGPALSHMPDQSLNRLTFGGRDGSMIQARL